MLYATEHAHQEGVNMLTEYLQSAMRHAEYEDLGAEGWFVRIPGFEGLWASGDTREDAQQELRSTLEDWLLLGVRLGHRLPLTDGIDLNVLSVA
jgi:predicted RNase H-like HicB family nuclease